MTLAARDHVVVVGAGLAGWRVCEELRRHGFTGALTLVGDEPHAPYDRPPLSKQVASGAWDLDRVTLATPQKVATLEVRLETGGGATGLDASTGVVARGSGPALLARHIVVATGSRARRLPWHHEGLFEMRTFDDAKRLRARLDELSPGDVVAVIGGGFIGAEVATAVRARGLTPVVLEAAPRPLMGPLGAEVATWLERLAGDHGVELRVDQRVSGVESFPGGDAEVHFADGSRLAARAVVVGVGAQPNVEWLEGSGLLLDDGVVVDASCVAHHQQDADVAIAAVGDVARFPLHGEVVRVEHWQVAADHAATLARQWMTGDAAGPMVPYFWSDQYGKKIQVLGHPVASDEVVRVKDTGEGQWLALYVREGRVSGAVALSQPRALMMTRPLVLEGTGLDEALRRAPWAT